MTSVSTLGQSLAQIERLKELQIQVDDLSSQLATGKVTQKFTGLQSEVLTSKRARAEFKTLERYTDNAVNADRRIKLTLNAIEEFKKQAENFSNALINLSQQNAHQQGQIVYFDDPLTPSVTEQFTRGMTSATADTELKALQDIAASLFDFMGTILNSKDGDRFLLGGAETSLQPFSDNGLLDSAMSGLINDWKNEASPTNLNTGQIIAALQTRDATVNARAVTDTIVGYNAPLSAGNVGDVFIRIDDNAEVNYTARANEQPFRDIMVAAAYFKNPDVTPIADTYIPPNAPPNAPDVRGAPGTTLADQVANWFQVFDAMAQSVNQAIKDIDQVRFRLENARARIDEVKKNHQESQNLLLNTIGDVEDIDINEAAVQINLLQIQLDASYRVTARVSQLSLVNFI